MPNSRDSRIYMSLSEREIIAKIMFRRLSPRWKRFAGSWAYNMRRKRTREGCILICKAVLRLCHPVEEITGDSNIMVDNSLDINSPLTSNPRKDINNLNRVDINKEDTSKAVNNNISSKNNRTTTTTTTNWKNWQESSYQEYYERQKKLVARLCEYLGYACWIFFFFGHNFTSMDLAFFKYTLGSRGV